MPSPLGHGLAGLTVHVLLSRDRTELRDWRRASVTVGAALAPDVDLMFRFVDGRNHHGCEMHSVGAVFLAALTGLLVFRLLGWQRQPALAFAVALAWASHIVLDLLNLDTNPPIGIQALWPFSAGYFKSPVLIFLDVGRTLKWTTVRHNAAAGAWECAVLVPLLLVAWRLRRPGLEVADGTRVRKQGGGGSAGVR
jgi:membrane-bound metal-dependent hydrolase YbcI (DUF457 family)